MSAEHSNRKNHHRQPRNPRTVAALRELDDLASEPTRSEQAEHRAAVDDRLDYRRIGVGLYAADRVPHEGDVE